MSRRARLIANVSFVMLGVILLSGCVSDDAPRKASTTRDDPVSASQRAEYSKQLQAAVGDTNKQFEMALASMQQGTTSTEANTAGRAASFRQLGKALGAAAKQLEAIDAPEPYEATHDQLTSAVGDLAESTDLLVRAAKLSASDPDAARDLVRAFATDDAMQRIQEATTNLEAAGVTTGL